jgi:hypothetical protein
MKKFLFIAALLIFSSCDSKDEQFCKCMQAGEELNAFSSALFEEEVTAEKAEKLKVLKTKQKKECADYQTMKGEEMLQRKEKCN